jgi:hypothetical protein
MTHKIHPAYSDRCFMLKLSELTLPKMTRFFGEYEIVPTWDRSYMGTLPCVDDRIEQEVCLSIDKGT